MKILRNKKAIIGLSVILLLAVLAVVIPFLVKHTVTFYSMDGSVMAIEKVQRNGSATPPAEPKMQSGYIFTGWDKDFSCVKGKLDVYPVCTEIDTDTNVIALAGAYGRQEESVVVPVVLTGDVCTCGLDVTVVYDPTVLEVEKVFDEDGAVLYNTDKPGRVHINYMSLGNTTGEVDLCKIMFKIIGDKNETDVKAEVVSIYYEKSDSSLEKADCKTIDAKIYVMR